MIFSRDEGMFDIETTLATLILNGKKPSLIVKADVPLAGVAYPCLICRLPNVTERKKPKHSYGKTNIENRLIDDMVVIA